MMSYKVWLHVLTMYYISSGKEGAVLSFSIEDVNDSFTPITL